MNVHVYNDGYTVALGADSESFAVVEWTHQISGHQHKTVCYEHEALMDVLDLHKTPGHYYSSYIPNIRYSEIAMQLYGIGGEVHAAT